MVPLGVKSLKPKCSNTVYTEKEKHFVILEGCGGSWAKIEDNIYYVDRISKIYIQLVLGVIFFFFKSESFICQNVPVAASVLRFYINAD